MNENKVKIFSSLCEIIEESEQMSLNIMNHLDKILEKLNNLENNKNLQLDVDGIIDTIMTIMNTMQSQDLHRQKIERVANLINPNNDKFAKAKNITSAETNNLVDENELESLMKQFAN
jgi:flagellar biosynthesis/type III secretory pathway chaperone